jgi:hypothetical protein
MNTTTGPAAGPTTRSQVALVYVPVDCRHAVKEGVMPIDSGRCAHRVLTMPDSDSRRVHAGEAVASPPS